jgi:hypothetical protein
MLKGEQDMRKSGKDRDAWRLEERRKEARFKPPQAAGRAKV